MPVRSNVLGDARAEFDKPMLDSAFFESPDYRTLIEGAGRNIVVGRRGAGKSALVYRLGVQWEAKPGVDLSVVAPIEDQVFGLRVLISVFGEKFSILRAASRIVWRYALLMEALDSLAADYGITRSPAWLALKEHLNQWRGRGSNVAERLRETLKTLLKEGERPEELVAGLARRLGVDELQNEVGGLLSETKRSCVLLIDRIDEGYDPDDIGIGIIDGLVQAAVDVNTRIPAATAIVFLRDNIFRSVAKADPDFSRDIEGQVLRLHWDETQLFNMVCGRLRIAFKLSTENDTRVWNACVAKRLVGRDGFRWCLQFTLYRPRDLIHLFNEAFLFAQRESRDQIIEEDIEACARRISETRLEDLLKEYGPIIPSLPALIGEFRNRNPEMGRNEAMNLLGGIFLRRPAELPAIEQDLVILRDPASALRELESLGFLGVRERAGGSFVFCHDGTRKENEPRPDDQLLVHPCYWMALNLTRSVLVPEEAAQINDEYDIGVVSETPHIRADRLNHLATELQSIPEGREGAYKFEEWSLNALRVVFAGALQNMKLHPNVNALQQRDIIGTNLGQTPAWRRILEDFHVRQAVFELKNVASLEATEFRQIRTYLEGDHGQLGFIVTRDTDNNPRKGRELDWIRELYYKQKVLVLKLTAQWIVGQLLKLRKPGKHDAVDRTLNYLLDQYSRTYLELERSKRK